MAPIYDMSTGTIVSENAGITTIEDHDALREYGLALQPVHASTPRPATRPESAYLALIRELLKDL